MKLTVVDTKDTEKKFIEAGKVLYRNDAEWICPLDNDIARVFSPASNEYYNDGAARRWVLEDDKGKLIGRVAAFYSKRNFTEGKKIGGMGFFECVDNEGAAQLLFDACKNWLQQEGVEGMDGPINFGERDKFWGLMVEGFKNPCYQENYNPPYYQPLFENYGFSKVIEQSTSDIARDDFDFTRFDKLAGRVLNNPKYTFEHIRKRDKDKFAADFAYIYNLAWQHHDGFTPLTTERTLQLIAEFMPIMKEDHIWFAYADGEPAGFYVNLIDVNQIFKHLNGKLNFWGKLKFLFYLKTKKVDRVRGIAYGIIPKYHNLGIDAGLIMKFYKTMQTHNEVQHVEMAWIGDFNPKMHSMLHGLGAKRTKLHYTYRLMF